MSVPERVTIAISELEMKLAGLRDRLADEALSLTEKIFDTFADDNQLMSSVLIRMYAAGLSKEEKPFSPWKITEIFFFLKV